MSKIPLSAIGLMSVGEQVSGTQTSQRNCTGGCPGCNTSQVYNYNYPKYNTFFNRVSCHNARQYSVLKSEKLMQNNDLNNQKYILK